MFSFHGVVESEVVESEVESIVTVEIELSENWGEEDSVVSGGVENVLSVNWGEEDPVIWGEVETVAVLPVVWGNVDPVVWRGVEPVTGGCVVLKAVVPVVKGGGAVADPEHNLHFTLLFERK
jgi:hypothetical protein